ncbi:unnamed protein product [Coffea canephora]|uniref:Methyltransferase type 11 domain-containing protein n=1 Tax=Coffea canephora TaxID=49390 RepID=A0A068UMM9_COFCA|nr:unnamed protein product [Coffea canephora]
MSSFCIYILIGSNHSVVEVYLAVNFEIIDFKSQKRGMHPNYSIATLHINLLASKYGGQAKGITLSPVEAAERARVLTAAQGLESQQISFEVADALNQPFEEGSFDLIWCIECENHISDKTKFVHELNRVAAPGATIILLTWRHRDLSPLEQDLLPDGKKLLSQLESRNRAKWISAADYMNLFKSWSFEEIKCADWSPHVAPYYAEMRKITLSWKGIMSYARHAADDAVSVDRYKNGLLKYCILTCQKPQ